jgi:chitin disaccharide deacetylase
MKAKKLIVNADDFGQSEGINEGIIKAHEFGIVTSASLMVRYPTAIEAAEYSKKNSRLGVGLHIDLGEWMFEDGEWEPLYEVADLDNKLAVEKEIQSQLESFYNIMGRQPTHIDSHQHIHLRETVRPICIKLAKELNVTLRRCSEKVQYCGNFYGQDEDGSPYHYAISVNGLKETISNLPFGVTELACHPGLNNDIETMYKYERQIEVDTLCNSSIKEAIANLNIMLCSFEKDSYTIS